MFKTIGMTGTREGMTDAQKLGFENTLASFGCSAILQHGGCVGADEDAHWIARSLGMKVIIYPGPLKAMTMSLAGVSRHEFVTVNQRRSFHVRNKIIADSDVLIVCPKEMQEQKCGGTWQTYRFAIAARTPRTIIYPDGRISNED